MRQREANMTALAAIGPRKQRRLDTLSTPVIHLPLFLLCIKYAVTSVAQLNIWFLFWLAGYPAVVTLRFQIQPES